LLLLLRALLFSLGYSVGALPWCFRVPFYLWFVVVLLP
jgi:hypothetical protein